MKGIDKKTRCLILYLIDQMAIPTKTSIIKMCYLCDLAAVNTGMEQITDFRYIRYFYGPFDKKVEDYLMDLAKEKEIVSELEYSSRGGEYERFATSEKGKERLGNGGMDILSENGQKAIVDSIIESLGSLNAKMLTDIAYKTKPMTRIHATLGGTEHFSESLNLAA